MSTPSCWPKFPTLGDLSSEELDEFLDDLIPKEGQAFTLSAALRRRRRLLLSPAFSVFRMSEDGVFTHALAPGGNPAEQPVDIVLTRFWVAEMPASNFRIKLVIGAEHEFNQKRRSPAAHARLADGVTGQYLGIANIPFLQGLKVGSGAALNVQVMFLDGNTSNAVVSFLNDPAFRQGINLVRTFNPVFATAAHYLSSFTQALLSIGKNRMVTQGIFGLRDFGGVASGSLGIGDYLLAQLPPHINDPLAPRSLHWDATQDRVMDGDKLLDANYMMIRIAPSTNVEQS